MQTKHRFYLFAVSALSLALVASGAQLATAQVTSSSTNQVKIFSAFAAIVPPGPGCAAGSACVVDVLAMTMTGVNFGTLAGDVKLGNVSLKAASATFTEWTNTSISLTLPVGFQRALGTYQIEAVSFAGLSNSGVPYRGFAEVSIGAGLPGAKGDQGAKGDTGAPGINGTNGAKGDTGATGPKGDTGATGPKGDTGAPGINGKDGKNHRVSRKCMPKEAHVFIGITPTTIMTVGPITGSMTYILDASVKAPWASGNKAIQCKIFAIEGSSTTEVGIGGETQLTPPKGESHKGTVPLDGVYTAIGGETALVTFRLSCTAADTRTNSHGCLTATGVDQ